MGGVRRGRCEGPHSACEQLLSVGCSQHGVSLTATQGGQVLPSLEVKTQGHEGVLHGASSRPRA